MQGSRPTTYLFSHLVYIYIYFFSAGYCVGLGTMKNTVPNPMQNFIPRWRWIRNQPKCLYISTKCIFRGLSCRDVKAFGSYSNATLFRQKRPKNSKFQRFEQEVR